MRCESCACEFHARAGARFCSGRCRVRAHRARVNPIPRELLDRDRWVTHRAKVPVTPFGRVASSTDPSTWRDYATAAAAVAAGGVDGVGFVLDGDGIACIDLDHCIREDGTLEEWAADIVAACPATYVEVSPSGTGLHVFGLAHVGKGRRSGGVEVYDRGRYMTVTGRRWASAPCRLSDISAVVASLG